MADSQKQHNKTFTVTVDGEPVEVSRKGVTARAILEIAGLDPATRYLIEKHGNQTISYKGKADSEVKVHQNQVFLTGRCGAVPVA